MAIKIDLLPKYVKLEKRFQRVLVACAGLLALWFGGLAVALEIRQLQLQTTQTDQRVFEAKAQETSAAKSAVDTARTTRSSYDGAINVFVSNSKSGAERSALFTHIFQNIYANSSVTLVDVSDGTNVTIKATVRDPEEYARFLQGLRRATGVLFAAPPQTTGVNGFANGAVPFVPPALEPGDRDTILVYPINLTATAQLLNPVKLPVDPVGGAPAAAGAAGTAGVGRP